MSFAVKRMLYESLPTAIKRSIRLIPFSCLAGSAYREVYRRGGWFDRASEGEVKQYQERELGEMLRFAVDQVPAYRSQRSVVERHEPFEALKAFPLLDKEAIQAKQEEYLPRDLKRIPHYESTTGGTSGNHLRLYMDDSSQSVEMGFMHRQWARVGYTPRCRKATFRGVSFHDATRHAFWQDNPIYNELQFSPFHMSESNLPAYVERIIQYAPFYLHGYPSAIDVLAEFVLRHGLSEQLPPMRAALLGSEGATAIQRERIERALGTRVYSWYGHSERLVLGGECERNSTYHHFPDYGIMEIVDDKGEKCNKAGDRGQIVGTSLLNRSMPLIRYCTGDYATRCESHCECGRCWDRFTDVQSRWKQEQIVGKSGLRIPVKRYSGSALKVHPDPMERVIRCQYYQDTPGICVLKIMVTPRFVEQDRVSIERAYNSCVGDEVRFTVQVVENIPLTVRGKVKMLDSRLELAAEVD